MDASAMEVEVIDTLEAFESVSTELDHLLEQGKGCTSFRQDPNWIRWEWSAASESKPFVMLVRQRGELVAAAIFKRDRAPFQLKFSVFKVPIGSPQTLKLIGDEMLISEAVEPQDCVRLILEKVASLCSEIDLVYSEMVELESGFGRYVDSHHRVLPGVMRLFKTSPKEEYVWRHYLKESYEAWLSTLGGSTRRLLKRRVKKLHKEYPDQVDVRRCTSAEDVALYLDSLNAVFPKTWQAKTFGMKKRNTEQMHAKFAIYANMGAFRSYILSLAGKPVAFFTGLQYRGMYEALEIGYDAEYASLGVGSALNYMVIEDLYSIDSPGLLSFGFGENVYKEMICTDKSEAYEAYIATNARWSLVMRLQLLAAKAEQNVRALLIRLKVDAAIRRILKNKS